MKKYIVPLSATVVAAVFFAGYYAGSSGRTSLQKQETTLPSAKNEGVEEDNKKNLSVIKEELTEKTESPPVKTKLSPAPSAAETEASLPDTKRQTRKQLVASLRKQGVPERDVERVANALAMLTGGVAPAPETTELSAQQREEIAASVQAAGVPEKDVERVASALGTAAMAEKSEKSHEEMKAEAVTSAREAGVPDEDIERVSEALAGPTPQEASSEQPDDEKQAEKKAEVAAKAREAGVPEQDVERVTNALTDASTSSTQKDVGKK